MRTHSSIVEDLLYKLVFSSIFLPILKNIDVGFNSLFPFVLGVRFPREEGTGDPSGLPRRLPDRPQKNEAPGTEINRRLNHSEFSNIRICKKRPFLVKRRSVGCLLPLVGTKEVSEHLNRRVAVKRSDGCCQRNTFRARLHTVL
jgi:hypothetical protein